MKSHILLVLMIGSTTVLACSGSSGDGPPGSGGSGAGGVGGEAQNGGSGGDADTGGSIATGGVSASGGSMATGGGVATGGVATGGSTGTGGQAMSTGNTMWPFDAAEAVRRQNETAAKLGLQAEVDVDLGGGVKMTMVVIPPGSSRLGGTVGVMGTEMDERGHSYNPTLPILMSKTVFTREQYNAVVGTLPNEAPMTGSGKLPALQSYCRTRDVVLPALKAHAPQGWTFRFPTGDEWEYAARAGTNTYFYTGNTEADLAKIAWYSGNAGGVLHETMLKQPNAWGIHDMIGNAWHWMIAGSGTCVEGTEYSVRGCTIRNDIWGNGCRTTNWMVSRDPEQYRFVATVPMPN